MSTTPEDMEMIRSVVKVMDKSLAPLYERIEALEKSPMQYLGVWRAGEAYPKNAFVTHKGAIWHASQDTTATPGDGGPAWTLAVKSGQPR